MNLKFKILSVTGLGVLGFIIFGMLTWNTLNVVKINGTYYQEIALDKDLIADILPPPEYIIESYLLIHELINEPDKGKQKEMVEKFKGLQDEYEKRHVFWSKNLSEDRLKEQMIVKSYQPAKEFFEIAGKELIPAVLEGNQEKIKSLMEGLKAKYQGHRLAIDEVVKLADAKQKKKEAEVAGITENRTTLLGVLALVIILLSTGLTWFFVEYKIIRKVADIITGLDNSAVQVSSAASQVSASSQSLAQGTSEQAAGIEETSSSFEEMYSMNKQTAENASQANSLMLDMTKVVDEANRTMGELTESMQEISAASEETGKIIKTIDEIAFQTNLLALNAAVEAARAGEAGAGFAVVADEVRNLAMRAAEAAKNTANLIEGTVKKIKNGSETVTRTNDAFAKVATGAKKVGTLVGDISAASTEQTQGIEQINKAVSEMDKAIQNNAANAEESASAAEELNSQAEQLKEFVVELSTMVGKGHTRREVTPKKLVAREVRRIQENPLGRKKELKALPSKAKEIRPEQVIPLDDGDFKEF